MDLNERIMTAIDMLTAMVVDEIALDDGRDPSDVLPEFLESRTAKLLYDEENKMWWDGPSAVVDYYRKEKSAADNQTQIHV